ncbi:MAG: MFS transporter [Cyanobacteria bacterium J055]|nr:MAG: MFS transporter [Cyanobacteria bacterium J055]
MKVFGTLDRQRKRSLWVLFTSGLPFWAGMASLLPTLPLYVQFVGGTEQQVGLVMGAFAIGLLASRTRLGNLADRRSRQLVLLIGVGVSAIAPLGYLFIQSIPWLIALRAFHGISIAAFTTAYSALVADSAPPDRRGELIGYMSLVTPVGVAIGPAIGGFVQAGFGYPPLFLMASVLGALSFVGSLQVLEPPRSVDRPPADKNATPPDTQIGGIRLIAESAIAGLAIATLWWVGFGASWGLAAFMMLQGGIVYSFLRQIFSSSDRLRIPSMVMLMVGTIFGTIATFMPLFIGATAIDFNPGWFYTAAAMSSFMMRLLAGKASDRFGRGLFISFGLVCYALAMSVLAMANSGTALLFSGLLEGAAAGILIPIVVALMSDRSQPEERGRLFALCIGGFDLGIAVAGPLFGAIAPAIGFRNIFAIAAAIAVVALLVFVRFNSKDLPHSLRFALGRGRDIYAISNK